MREPKTKTFVVTYDEVEYIALMDQFSVRRALVEFFRIDRIMVQEVAGKNEDPK